MKNKFILSTVVALVLGLSPLASLAATVAHIEVVSYGLDSQVGGKKNLPVTWTITGPNGFSETRTDDAASFSDLPVGTYTISTPRVTSYDGIRYELQEIKPCSDGNTSCNISITAEAPNKFKPAPPEEPRPAFGGFKDVEGPREVFPYKPSRPFAKLDSFLSNIFKSTSKVLAVMDADPGDGGGTGGGGDTGGGGTGGGTPPPAEATTTKEAFFAIYYSPKPPLQPCASACDPQNPDDMPTLGSMDINPSLLYDGTYHTVSITGGVPYAPVILRKTIWESDNRNNPRMRAVGGGGGDNDWRSTTPFYRGTYPGAWKQFNGSGNWSGNFTASCDNDGTGIPVKGYRLETNWASYSVDAPGYSAPEDMVSRDCRGTVKIHVTGGTALGTSWILSGMSDWDRDVNVLSPIKNTNVAQGPDGNEFQGYNAIDVNTISFKATDGPYTMTGLPNNCTVNMATQSVSPGDTTTFEITCDGGNGNNPVSCSPAVREVGTDQNASFTASGGNGTFSWTATGGATGSGSGFQVSYSTEGDRTVSVTSGNQTASCTVSVNNCDPTLTISPTSRTIDLPDEIASYTATYDSDGTCSANSGSNVTTNTGSKWSIVDATIATSTTKGKFKGLKAGSSQVQVAYSGLTAIANITVRNLTTPDFACVVEPDSFEIYQGDSQEGTIRCSPLRGFTGRIDLKSPSVPTGASMVITPSFGTIVGTSPFTVNYTFTAGLSTPVGAHAFDVVGSSTAITHNMPVNPIVKAAVGLDVSLVATPASGKPPLSTDLKATVSGSATGNIDYYFWWNCNSNSSDLTTVAGACGAPNSTSLGQASVTKTVPHTYDSVNVYRPKVVVSRGGLWATNWTNVTVSNVTTFTCIPRKPSVAIGEAVTMDPVNGNGPFTWQAPGGSPGTGSGNSFTTSYSTNGNKTVTVRSSTGNIGTCQVNVGTGGGSLSCTPPSQSAVVNELVSVSASGGSGGYEWNAPEGQPSYGTGNQLETAYSLTGAKTITVKDSSNATATCNVSIGPGDGDGKHLSCVSNTCSFVDGEGEDSCSPEGVACSSIGSCTFAPNPSVIKKGQSSSLKWTCDSGIDSCVVMNGGSRVASGGRSGAPSVSPDKTTEYRLVCDGGEVDLKGTVYVVQSYQEVPPGGN